MSIRLDSTGMPVARTSTTGDRIERVENLEIVDHQVEDDVDVEAARREHGETLNLDEARRRPRPRAAPHRRVVELDVPDRQDPRPSAASISRSASARLEAIGFSTST